MAKTQENGLKKAFTLAEVLITLAIIGVVAALTIPTVVKNYQKHVAAVRLKKMYDVISQAILKAEAENGPMATWDMGCEVENVPNGSSIMHICYDPTVFHQRYLLPYLKVIRYCDSTDASKGCPPFTFKYLSGDGLRTIGPSREYPIIYLADGTRMWASAADLWYTNTQTGALIVKYSRGELWVDITGDAGPNTAGKDIFSFYLLKDYMGYSGLKLGSNYLGSGGASSNDRENACNKKKTYNGLYCAELIAKDGWQIKYDW